MAPNLKKKKAVSDEPDQPDTTISKAGRQKARFYSYSKVLRPRRAARLWVKEPWCQPDYVPSSSDKQATDLQATDIEESILPEILDAVDYIVFKSIRMQKRMQNGNGASQPNGETSRGAHMSHPLDVVAILAEMSNRT